MSGHPKLIVRIPTRGIYPQFDYYVDSVNGDDVNYDGRSSGSPYATLTKLASVWRAGEKVALARGSSWKGRLTSPGEGSKAYAYGTSENPPEIDCAVTAANASFSKTGGRTNVYEIAVTVDYLGYEPHWNSMWEDGARLTRASGVADCDATPGSMYASNDNAANVTLYVHASDSSDVIANGKLYEYAKWGTGWYSWFHPSNEVYGIKCRRNLWEAGSIKMGKNSLLANSIAEEGHKHNVYVRTGCFVANVIATKSYYAGVSSSLFVYNEDSPNNEGVNFQNCQALLDTWSTAAAGFYGHNNVSGSFGRITYDGCIAENLSAAFQGQHASLMIARNCIVTDCQSAIWPSAGSNWNIENMSFVSSIVNSRGVSFQGDNVIVTIDGYDMVFSANGAVAIGIFANNTPVVDIKGMKIDGVAGDTYGVWHSGAGGTVQVQDSDYSEMYRTYRTELNSAAITSDYNRFRQASLSSRVQGTDYATVALYQAGTGQDSHSTIG